MKNSEFYWIIKANKLKSFKKTILQNDHDSIKNVSEPNDLKSRPIVAGPNSQT